CPAAYCFSAWAISSSAASGFAGVDCWTRGGESALGAFCSAGSATVGAAAWAGRNEVCFGWVVWHPAVNKTAATANGKMARIRNLIYCETASVGLCGGAPAMLHAPNFRSQRSRPRSGDNCCLVKSLTSSSMDCHHERSRGPQRVPVLHSLG